MPIMINDQSFKFRKSFLGYDYVYNHLITNILQNKPPPCPLREGE